MAKKTILIIIVVALLGTIAAYATLKPKKETAFNYIVAKKIDLFEEVTVTGKVKPKQDVELAFEQGGKIEKIYVGVGEKVNLGQIIMNLEDDDLEAQYNQAQAASRAARAQLSLSQAETDAVQAQVGEGRAFVEVQGGKLNELNRGPKQEQIDHAQINLENAKKTLVEVETSLDIIKKSADAEYEKGKQTIDDAKINLKNVESKTTLDLQSLYQDVSDILHDGYSKADDALFHQTDDMFTHSQGYNLELLNFVTLNNEARAQSETLRFESKNKLQTFQQELNQLTEDSTALDRALMNGKTYLLLIRNYIESLSDALDDASNLSEVTINTYKTSIQSARTNNNTAITTINNQKQLIAVQKKSNEISLSDADTKLTNAYINLKLVVTLNEKNITAVNSQIIQAKNAVEAAKSELALQKAGATKEEIAIQEAVIKQSEAQLAFYKAKFESAVISQSTHQARLDEAQSTVKQALAEIKKTIIYSPIDGVVTKQEYQIGEVVSPGIPVVAVISETDFQIETHVPEIDIEKIKISDPAQITLDAYGNEVIFVALISAIDPAETVIEGIPTYKVTLHFVQPDTRIKSGMTANINIKTDSRTQVIAIPQRAITIDEGTKKVKRFTQEGSIEEVTIKTGLRGSNGYVEILEGIEENDKIVIFLPQS